jgi:hypothetical protein
VVLPAAAALGVRIARQRRAADAGAPLADQPFVENAFALGSAALDVLSGCGRSPGCRIIGVRPVLARDGTPVGPGRALARTLIMQAPQLVVRQGRAQRREEARRRAEATRARSQEIAERLRAVEQEHAGDEEALNRARAAVFKSSAIKFEHHMGGLLAAGGRQFLTAIAVHRLAARLRDALTGETVVVEA